MSANLILITGLDGCGKSTLLSRLEQQSGNHPVSFLRVPVTEPHKVLNNPLLKKTCEFINLLNTRADELRYPQLKALAMFSAMLLFDELVKELQTQDAKVIFCERHPLVDTAVYAKFYNDKMDPEKIPAGIAAFFEQNYPDELDFLFQKIPGDKNTSHGKIYWLGNFIHSRFGLLKKTGPADLAELFGSALPSKIIYLRASAATLSARLAERKMLEAHESEKAFEMMLPVYEEVLTATGVETDFIDANHVEHLDELFLSLKQDHFF